LIVSRLSYLMRRNSITYETKENCSYNGKKDDGRRGSHRLSIASVHEDQRVCK